MAKLKQPSTIKAETYGVREWASEVKGAFCFNKIWHFCIRCSYAGLHFVHEFVQATHKNIPSPFRKTFKKRFELVQADGCCQLWIYGNRFPAYGRKETLEAKLLTDWHTWWPWWSLPNSRTESGEARGLRAVVKRGKKRKRIQIHSRKINLKNW